MREKRSLSRLLLCSTLALFMVLPALPAWAQTYKIIYAFPDQDNLGAGSALVRDQMGNLYGGGYGPTYGPGVIYKISPAGAYTVLHKFTGSDGDGADALTLGPAGTLYGTSYYGGLNSCPNGCGVLFQLSTSTGKETVLHRFNPDLAPADGISPDGGVIVGPNGQLYGVTQLGGLGGYGVLYEFANGKVTVLHTFADGGDGGSPATAPLLVDGSLYGTTTFGGNDSCEVTGEPQGCGTVYKFDGGVEQALYTFQDGPDGGYPGAGLIADSEGNLYGTTVLGGDDTICTGRPPGCGAVFKLSPRGQGTSLHAFTAKADGAWPSAALVRDGAGNLYGTAYFGGDYKCGDGCGTIFKIDTLGKFSVIHSFKGEDGSGPTTLILSGHKLYGIAHDGGPANRGVIYELTLK